MGVDVIWTTLEKFVIFFSDSSVALVKRVKIKCIHVLTCSILVNGTKVYNVMLSCSNGGCCGVFKLWHEKHDGKSKQVKCLYWVYPASYYKNSVEQHLMNDSEKHKGCNLLHFVKLNM